MIFKLAAGVGTLLIAVIAGGCSELSRDETVETRPATTLVFSRPLTDNEFCTAMTELRSQALAGTVRDDVLQVYIDLRPVVPDDIISAFDQMIAQIEATQSGVAPTTAAPDTNTDGLVEGESRSPTYDSPAERVQLYVEQACLGVADNPGPEATSPP